MFNIAWPALPLLIEFVLKLLFIGFILSRHRPNPAVTLTWIVIILALPLIGFIAYLLVGEVRLGRRRVQRHRDIVKRVESSVTPTNAIKRAIRADVPLRYRAIAALGEAVSNTHVLGGNQIELISETDDYINRHVEDVDNASEHCHLLYYIYLADNSGVKIGEALCRAAKRGVDVRLLVDDVGSKHFLCSALCAKMRKAGVQVVGALPASVLRMAFARVDLRNHRKITVIDGVIGYTGSQNIADAEFAPKAKYAPWYDTSVRIVGPIVHDLQMLFIEDWFLDTNEALEELLTIETPLEEDGMTAQILGTGPSAYNEAMRQLMQSALHTARDELILTTPYLVPDEATATAICTAARRGVETFLVVPARNDSPFVRIASRSYYEMLLEAGVHLYEFPDGLLHSKTMTLDRELAMVSTANLDRRSFELNFEVSVVVYDSDFASQLRFQQRAYMNRSDRIDPVTWKQRGLGTRLVQNAMGLLSPLL